MIAKTNLLRITLAALAVVLAASLCVLAKPAKAAFPGQNAKLVYDVNAGANGRIIYTMNPDGSQKTPVTDGSTDDKDPTVSPDGQKIAFESDRDGNSEIYVMNIDGSNQIRLTNDAGVDLDPAWSPNGTRIAFTSYRDFNPEIYTMDAKDVDGDGNGDNPTRLTNNLSYDLEPAWSPDGTKIAFASSRDGDYEILTMNASDGSGVKKVTNNDLINDLAPSWSPNGAEIAFTSNKDGDYDVYRRNADGSEGPGGPGPLTHNSSANDEEPAWSPDGTKIAFASDQDGDYDIYVTTLATGAETKLNTTSGSTERNPDWQRSVQLPPKHDKKHKKKHKKHHH